MSGSEQITARQHAILMAVVMQYLEAGEPVGSGSVAGFLTGGVGAALPGGGLSPATVRNEMNALTGMGWLEQPHTSAGRIPTARALKRYVDGLSAPRALAHTTGRGLERTMELERTIDLRLGGLSGATAVLEQTSLMLATLSSGVGLAIAGGAESEELEHVHFSRLSTGRVLAVVVTRAGTVRDRLLQLERDYPIRELEAASAFLNERFRGWGIERIREEIARLLDAERSAYQAMLATAGELWRRAQPEQSAPFVHVYGVGNLVGTAARDGDAERLREVMAALEAKVLVAELLTAYLEATGEDRGRARVRVEFDMERRAPEMAGLVLIAATTRLGADRLGAVGVIGPPRMDYERTIDAVRYVAEVFPRIL